MQLKKFTQKDRHGNMFSYEFNVPSMNEVPKPDHPGEPRGTDTVPAWLTPGENVINAEASRLPGVQPLLDDINDMGRAIQKKQGGPIPSYNAEGSKVEGKSAGKDTGMRTVTDKKVYETPDGYKVSEQRITVGDNTHGYGHVPSIYNGIQYTPQQIEQMLYQGQIPQPDMRFKTPTEADYYARLNSQNLMNFRDDGSYLQEGGVIGENQINYGSKNTYTDYYGRPYQVSKLYQPINNDLVKGEVEKMKDMGLPNNQMMTALEDNLNLSSDQAVSALQPTQNSLIGGSSGSTVSQIPKYNAEGTPRSTDLVQNFMDQASDMHDSVYLGKPPKYFNEGGVTITDDIVNAMMQVESGGDVNAESEAGAIGPMQILPSTAQNPGYGVKPIALEDLKNPVLAKDFAKRYMQKLADRNPHLSRDEIITAYHSGLSNVLKARSGQEKLGPRGQEYASKVNAIMGEIPMPEPRPAVYDSTPIESGFMSAQASTGDNEIPEPVDQDMYSGMNPVEIKRFELGVDDDIILDSTGAVQPVNPNRVSEDIPKKLAEKFAKDGNEKSYNFYMEDYNQAVKQDKAYKKYIADKEASDKKAEFIEKSGIVTNKTKELDAKIEEAKKNNNSTLVKALEDEKEKLKQSLIPGSVNNTSPELKQIVNSLVTQTNDSPAVKENTKIVTELGAKKAKEDPTTYDYIKGFFSQFFDTQELTRAALAYLGSRALGYEHGSSVNYVGKNYLKRIDAQMDANKKWANSKAATDNYEQSSIQRFLINGDRSELVKKGSSIKKPLTPMFDRNTQKVVQMFEMADGTTAARIEGKLIPYPQVAGRLDTLDPKIHDSTTIKDNFAKASKDYLALVNKDIDEEKQINQSEIRKVSNQAESLLRNEMKNQKFKKDTVARAEIISELEAAMGDYYEAYRRYLKGETGADKPSSLKEFFNKRMITFRTGGIWTPDLVKDTSAERLQEVQNSLFDMLKLNDVDENKLVKVAENFQNQLKTIWNKYSKMSDKALEEKGLRKNFIGTKTKGMNDFINWVNQVVKNDPDALKIISALEKE